jgi:uncharacterized protein
MVAEYTRTMPDDILFALLGKLNQDGVLTLVLKVRPAAAHTRVKGLLEDGTIKLDVAAAPEDGKANAALTEFFAETFGVPRAHVEILAGLTSARKTVRVTR